MWITTSKNADNSVKKFARSLADALPQFDYFSRGGRTISKLDRLAQREGMEVYLVVGKSGTNKGKMSVWSRKYVVDGDSAMWMWNSKRMDKFEFSKGGWKEEDADEPLEFEWKESAVNDEFAEFFGYVKGKSDWVYEESVKIAVEAAEKSAKITCEKKTIAEFEFVWENIDGSEE